MTTVDFDQHLVDYTVRNIMTGDEEDLRLLELTDDEIDTFPDAVRDDVRSLLSGPAEAFRSGNSLHSTTFDWTTAQDAILSLLLPHISDRALYDADYTLWESRVLEPDAVEPHLDFHAGYAVGWAAAKSGAPSPVNAGRIDTTTNTREAGYHAGFRDQCLMAGVLEDDSLHACDTCDRPLARPGEDLCDYCGHFSEGADDLDVLFEGLDRIGANA